MTQEMMAHLQGLSEADQKEVLEHAEKLETAVMEIANGERKPGKIPLESLVRLIAFAQTGKIHPSTLRSKK